jgi:hypothetical protein
MRKYVKGVVIFLLSLFLIWSAVGCRAISPGIETVQPAQPTDRESAPAATPSPAPIRPDPDLAEVTPTPGLLAPTAAPHPVDPICVPFRPQETLPHASYHEMPSVVLDFLNTGGTLEALDEGLYQAGIANQPAAAASGDFTGNGKLDVVISIYNPQSQSLPPAGQMVIYKCQNDAYELGFTQESPEFSGAPGILYIKDLTGDSVQEIVSNSPSCGVHTCYEYIEIFAWDGEAFTNRLVGATGDLPFPVVNFIEQEDRTFDLVVSGSGIGSVGAGPQRDQIRRWSYQSDREVWEVIDERLGESSYRIHVLHDADQAAETGDYDVALILYQRVISDTTLVDWVNPVEEQDTLAAYARYRLVLLYQIRGQDQFSQITLREMEQTYPETSSLHAYTLMAKTMMDAYASDGLEAACREARNFARENETEILAPLGPEAFGYGNPAYTPEDVCPW